MVPPGGIEPPASSLPMTRSTPELRRRILTRAQHATGGRVRQAYLEGSWDLCGMASEIKNRQGRWVK
jgi:hypothetical protein